MALSTGRVEALEELVRLNFRARLGQLDMSKYPEGGAAQAAADLVEYDMLLIMALPEPQDRNQVRAIVNDTCSAELNTILGA